MKEYKGLAYSIYKHGEKSRKENKLIKERIDKLSILEKNAVEEILERNAPQDDILSWVITPFKAVIWLFIIAAVWLFFFEINIFMQMEMVAKLLLSLFPFFVLVGVLSYFRQNYERRRILKRLLKIKCQTQKK